MKLAEAARVLGIDEVSFTENGVRIAYKRAVRLAHPDTGGALADNGAAYNIARAQEARDVLLKHLQQCDTCHGTGQERFGVLNRVCHACGGSGKK